MNEILNDKLKFIIVRQKWLPTDTSRNHNSSHFGKIFRQLCRLTLYMEHCLYFLVLGKRHQKNYCFILIKLCSRCSQKLVLSEKTMKINDFIYTLDVRQDVMITSIKTTAISHKSVFMDKRFLDLIPDGFRSKSKRVIFIIMFLRTFKVVTNFFSSLTLE